MTNQDAPIAVLFRSLDAGGAQLALLNLARGLVERGFKVDIVTVQARGPLVEKIPARTRLVDLQVSRAILSVPAIARYIRTNHPAALISGLTYMNLVNLWANLFTGHATRSIISEHGYTDWGGPESPNRREKLLPPLTPIFYPRADAIVAVSNGLAQAMASHLGLPIERIQVIHNPIITPETDTLIHEGLEHAWQASGDVPVILAAGRLEPVKDYPTLLRAFARLLQHREAHLVILGEGSQREALESLADELGVSSKIEMPGFVQNPLKFMHRAKVLVVSSTFEGFGNVLVEALACGTQVVSTNCPGGPSEILAAGEYGRLVPVGNPEALAGAIEAALDAPIPSEKLISRASLFSMETATEGYLNLIFPGKSHHE